MKIQTKIGLGLLPLVLLSITVLGSWSIRITTNGIEKSAFQHMNTLLDSYVDDKIRDPHRLLVRNLLDNEESFITDYQRLAAKSAEELELTKTGHIFVLNADGKFVFGNKKIDPRLIESVWGKHSVSIADGTAAKLTGHHHALNTGAVYAARYFEPWEWVIFYATADDGILAAKQAIRNVTILIAVFCAATSWLLIFFVIRNFLIRPVGILQNAASKIAKGETITNIDVNSQDELGELTRNMEFMAKAIQEHQAEQKVWQEKLETKVKEQTKHLTKEIDERKQVDKALHESERFLSAVFDSIQDGISVLDNEMKVVRVNQAMRDWYAYALPLEGKRCYEVYHGREKACDVCPVLRSTQTGKIEMNEVPLIQQDGTPGTLELFAFPMLDDSTQVVGVVEYVRNITKRKHGEVALRESERMKGVLEMAGAVCHELNQPLMAIAGYSDLMSMKLSKDDPLLEKITRITEQSDRLKKITQKLMNITRYETKDYLKGKIIDIEKSSNGSIIN